MLSGVYIGKKWVMGQSDRETEELFSRTLAVSKVVARILIQRGMRNLDDARRFLDPHPDNFLDPFLLTGMREACDLIHQAKDSHKKILVFGDYDVDGITSTAVVIMMLRRLGCEARYYIPNRLEEGYGLNVKGVDFAKSVGVGLLVTVDCGITAIKEVEYAKSLGMDVVIIDHHLPEHNLPESCIIINPKQPNCPYPFKDLCGVGLAFKLSQAMLGGGMDFLDLAAFGTVADIVPLVRENRLIVKLGLEKMSVTDILGLKELIEVSSLTGKSLAPHHIGFVLGPRMNAAGRLGEARWGIDLLLATLKEDATMLAQRLETENNNRKKIEAVAFEAALAMIEKSHDLDKEHVIVLYGRDWHMGVIGIVASKLVSRFYRPVILFSGDGEVLRGSGRSIENFNLYKAIETCKEILLQFGGHAFAAGLSIDTRHFDEFKNRINAYCRKAISKDDLIPSILVDSVLDINDVNFKLVTEVERLAPFGTNNPRPVFMSEKVKIKSEPQLLKNEHLKIWIGRNHDVLELIGFHMGPRYEEIRKYKEIDIVYSIGINEWRGQKTIQLQLKDFKPS